MAVFDNSDFKRQGVDWSMIEKGGCLLEKDLVRTDYGGRFTLSFEDGSLLRVNSLSQFEIKPAEKGGPVRVNLEESVPVATAGGDKDSVTEKEPLGEKPRGHQAGPMAPFAENLCVVLGPDASGLIDNMSSEFIARVIINDEMAAQAGQYREDLITQFKQGFSQKLRQEIVSEITYCRVDSYEEMDCESMYGRLMDEMGGAMSGMGDMARQQFRSAGDDVGVRACGIVEMTVESKDAERESGEMALGFVDSEWTTLMPLIGFD